MYKQPITVELVDNLDRVDEIIDYIHETGIVCFDFETKGAEGEKSKKAATNKNTAVPTMLSLSIQLGYSYVIPMFHDESPFDEDEISTIFLLLNSVFGSSDVRKVAHNGLFDIFFLHRYGVNDFNGIYFDTLKLHGQIDENMRHRLSDDLTPYYFPVYKDYHKNVDYNGELEPLAEYAGYDTALTLALFYMFEDWMTEDDLTFYRITRNINNPFFKAAIKLERFGSRIDELKLKQYIEETQESIDDWEIKLRQRPEILRYEDYVREQTVKKAAEEAEEAWKDFKEKYGKDHRYTKNRRKKFTDILSGATQVYEQVNFNSPAQMKDFLFLSKKGLKLEPKKDRISGEVEYTTNKDYLKSLDHPFIVDLLQFRKLTKVQSTYLRGIYSRLHNGKLHPNIRIEGTATGRISMSDPNLMNQPRKTNTGVPAIDEAYKKVKKSFIPSAVDRVITQADFSQMELRLVANFSEDDNMIQAYLDGIDIHSVTGSTIAGKSLKDFLDSPDFKDGRQTAKSANFGLIYLISLEGYIEYVYNQTGNKLSMREAQLHMDSIFKTYPKLRHWHKKYEKLVKKQGYVETWFGRRRRLPDIYSSQSWIVNQAIRNAVNSPIQGTGGQYTLYVMGLCDILFPEDWRLINSVHDSILHDLKKEHLNSYREIMQEVSENPPLEHHFKKKWGAVPMKMDFEYSDKSWLELQEF